MPSYRILVIEHEEQCPPDRLARWLPEALPGAEIEVVQPYRGDVVPEKVDGAALVVLGGSMGAHDDADHGWLAPTRDLLGRAVEDAVPTLGVCLGAQLLAAACGGRAEAGAAGIEAGVIDVRWRPEAAADPLVGALPEPFPGPSMHLDAITALPVNASWLGETDHYDHQVFRVGEAAWGVQFHPEVTPATFNRWGGQHEARGDWTRWGIDGDAVVRQLVDRDAEVVAAGRALTGRFADIVRSAC